MECPSCFESLGNTAKVTCPNGHSQCEKCHLSHIEAMYDRSADLMVFTANKVQNCFLCRTKIADNEFSPKFWDKLAEVQTDSIAKQMLGRHIGLLPTALREQIVNDTKAYYRSTQSAG